MKLQAILFDMGGTLDTYHYTREHRLTNIPLIRECLSKVGVSLSADDERLVDMITTGAGKYLSWNRESNVELKPSEIWSQFFLEGNRIGPERLVPIEEELAFLYETRLYIRALRPEAPQVLESIQNLGLRIGLISNTQSRKQVPFNLREYGIADYFNPIVLSSEYGRRKPDPSIFYYAARLADLPTGSCAYVGDKINRDILGARLAGYRCAVQIKHEFDNGEDDTGATPDAVIHNLGELLPMIEHELARDRKSIHPRQNKRIKALFFDAGDIMYHRPNKSLHFKEFLNGKTLNKPPDFEAKSKQLKDLAFSGKIKRHDYYEKIIKLYGFDSPDEIREGINAMSLDDNTVEIIAGVPETIKNLKANGFILGIITDTAFTFSRKLKWFDEYGFGRVWDTVISSKEIGVRKPSPDMYEKALKQTGVDANQAVFVGHKKTELDGAKAVGMHTVAFNFEDDAKADFYLDHFSDLAQLHILEIEIR